MATRNDNNKTTKSSSSGGGRKGGPSKSAKGKKTPFLFSLAKSLFGLSVLFLLFVAIYLIIASAIDWQYKPFPGTNISAEKIPIDKNKLELLTESDLSDEISNEVRKLATSPGGKFLLIDMTRFPEHSGLAKDNKMFQMLASAKSSNPGLDIILMLDSRSRGYSKSCPGIYAELVKKGINVIFSDPSLQKNYRWIYSPGAGLLARIFRSEKSDSSKDTFSCKLDKWQNKSLARNIIVSESSNGLKALLGAFSFQREKDKLQAAALIKGDAVAPLLKSELFLARAFLAQKGNGFSKNGETALLRLIELKIKSLPEPSIEGTRQKIWIEFLTEKAVFDKLEWMLGGLTNGDSVNIVAGLLDDPKIIEDIGKANSKNCNIRIIFDRNAGVARSGVSPGMPNSVVAKELYEKNKKLDKAMEMRWLEGATTDACIVHVYNENAKTSRILICSSSWNKKTLRGYDLASALYIEGEFKGAESLRDFFDIYWQNRSGVLRTTEYSEYSQSNARSTLNQILFTLKKWIGSPYKVENSQ